MAGGATLQYVIEEGDDLLFYYRGGVFPGIINVNGVLTLGGVELPGRQTSLGKTSMVGTKGGMAMKVAGMSDENREFLLERFPQMVKAATKQD